jgi:hypothetical protein
VLSAYITFLSRTLRSQDSIKNYVNGVKVLHLLKGVSHVAFEDISVKLTLKGVAKTLRHTPRQAEPITPGMLVQMANWLDLNDPADASFWALFLVCFFLLLRKSNVVPVAVKNFDSSKQFTRSDFSFSNNVMLVNGKWAKNNQCGKHSGGLPVLPLPGSILCPVSAYVNMCRLVPAESSSPAFGLYVAGRYKPITYRQYQYKLKSLVEVIGKDPGLYSTHSFRRGGATFAFRAGIPGELIQVLGDWRSDAYLRYLDIPLEVKTVAAARFRHQIQVELKSVK